MFIKFRTLIQTIQHIHKHKFATALVNIWLRGFKHKKPLKYHFLTEGLILQSLNSLKTGFVWRVWGIQLLLIACRICDNLFACLWLKEPSPRENGSICHLKKSRFRTNLGLTCHFIVKKQQYFIHAKTWKKYSHLKNLFLYLQSFI